MTKAPTRRLAPECDCKCYCDYSMVCVCVCVSACLPACYGLLLSDVLGLLCSAPTRLHLHGCRAPILACLRSRKSRGG